MEQLRHLRVQLASMVQSHNLPSILPTAIGLVFVLIFFRFSLSTIRKASWENSTPLSYLKFAYSCFIKPHQANLDAGQQSALESFYGAQVSRCLFVLHWLILYRRPCTTPRGSGCFSDGRIYLALLQHSCKTNKRTAS